ncbi:MAG: UbiA family prenyltransferase [Candidatus Woesearchaeota archaeon]
MLGSILRLRQWYKNLVVFLPILFVGRLFDAHGLFLTCLGFVALCLVSSSSYIINDIADRKSDRFHPEKKLRPIASGKVKVLAAALLSSLLLVLGMGLAYFLSLGFLLAIVALFTVSLLYTFWLKKEALVDIIVISVNFVIRAASGAFIISVVVSPWLVLCTFFLSLFLASGKRSADLELLKGKASKYKEVLRHYTPEATHLLAVISATLLIVAYSLYSFLSLYPWLLLTLPIALYVTLRYLFLIRSGSFIARRPELAYKDKRLVMGILLWVMGVLLVIYI